MSTPPSSSDSELALLELDVERVVRFDDQCLLIPEHQHSRLPRFLQRSYSLSPMFRRGDSPPNLIDEAANADVIPNVSRPSLITRLSKMAHSPSPRRSSSVDRVPLSPCLVHHDHDHDCDHPPRPRPGRARRPSLPDPIMRSPSSPGAVELATVPLRPCCVQCFKVTEACLAHGDAWRERFTRAARNRRNASVDFQMARQNRSPVLAPTPGSFAAVTVDEVAKEGIILHDSPEADVLHGEEAQSPRLVVEEDEAWATSVPADVLGAGLTRRMLSPIPSRNVSTEELLVSRKPSSAADEVIYEDLVKADSLLVSPPSSPPLRTPSPPERSVSSSPKHRFKFPASSELLRAGVDMFKGVGSFSPTPV